MHFFRERIDDYKRDMSQLNDDYDDQEASDFVRAFMQEKKRRDKKGEPHYFADDQLVSMLFDLWIAGQVRSFGILSWLENLLNKYHSSDNL